MRIVIPTYLRLDKQLTLSTLAPELHKFVDLVVRPAELVEACQKHPGIRVCALPEGCDDLLKTRQWIWETWSRERFCMLDDDITAFEKRCINGVTIPITLPQDQLLMFQELEEQLDLGAGVVSPRNHWAPPRKGTEIVHAADVVQFFMLDGPELWPLKLRWDRIMYVEDQDFCLQVLSHGVDVVQHQSWSFRARSFGEGEGGLNVGLTWGERANLAHEAAAKLAGLWPGYMLPAGEGRFRVNRKRLLDDSRRKLGMAKEEEEKGCGACAQPKAEDQSLCPGCESISKAGGGDPDALDRVVRWLRASAEAGEPEVTRVTGRKRGRPPLGDDHPVLVKMRGKGSFRVEDVAELYHGRGSASVSLLNLVRKGKLERVGRGLYQVKRTPLIGAFKDVEATILMSATPPTQGEKT